MFVERGAVEIAETVRVVGKMPGHPVEQYAEIFAMAGIDQRGEIGGSAEPAGGREQAGRLIAPGAIEGMFADGKKLDMGEAEIAGIARKLLGEFAIGQPLVVALAPPRPEVNLIDRHRCVKRVDVGWGGAGTAAVLPRRI